MKKGDFLIIAIIAAFSLISLIPLAARPEGRYVVISENGSVLYYGSILDNTVIQTAHNTIEILNSHVRVISTDCPDKLCLRSGEATVSHPIICLPNRLVVQIQSGEEDLDAVSY